MSLILRLSRLPTCMDALRSRCRCSVIPLGSLNTSGTFLRVMRVGLASGRVTWFELLCSLYRWHSARLPGISEIFLRAVQLAVQLLQLLTVVSSFSHTPASIGSEPSPAMVAASSIRFPHCQTSYRVSLFPLSALFDSSWLVSFLKKYLAWAWASLRVLYHFSPLHIQRYLLLHAFVWCFLCHFCVRELMSAGQDERSV